MDLASVLNGTKTLAVAQEIGLDRHAALLDQYLDEPARLSEQRQLKLQEAQTFERSEWQMAKDALEVEKARLFLMINETPSDSGQAAAAAEVLRAATSRMAQAKEKLDVVRSKLLLQVMEEVDDKGKPKYGNGDLRDAKLAVIQDESHEYQVASEEFRDAEEAFNKAKADADRQAPKPKYSNAESRQAALVQLQQTDIDYQAALAAFRKADMKLTNLKGEADAIQQEIANVSAKLWGLRELVKGDAAVLMAMATLDGPTLPREIRIVAPDSLPAIHLVSKGAA